MTSCERVQELLGRWLDGELSPDEDDRIREHVTGCAACQGAKLRLEKISATLRAALNASSAGIQFEPFWSGLERRIRDKRPWYGGVVDWTRDLLTAPRVAWSVPATIALVLAVVSIHSYYTASRALPRSNAASVESIDSYGRSVALLREDDTKTTVIWLYQEQEGENEAAQEPSRSGPAF